MDFNFNMNTILTFCIEAFIVGIFHTLAPGHCKTAMAGALLTSKHPWLDPLRLSVASALGHIIGLFVCALLSASIAHEIFEHLEIAVSVVIFLIGLFMLLSAIHSDKHGEHCCCEKHHHRSDYALPSVGFLIGIIPCPSVIALTVNAVTLNSAWQIFIYACSFGLGVALSLMSVGLIVTLSSKKIAECNLFQRLSNWSVYIPPCIFMLIGIAMFLTEFLGEHH